MMTDDGPITQAEMVQMFGTTMPMAAVELLTSAPPWMTLRELRAELRQIAEQRKPMTDKYTERAREIFPDNDLVSGPLLDYWRARIAQALRQERNDTLERAAQIVRCIDTVSHLPMDTRIEIVAAIGAAIRALKDD